MNHEEKPLVWLHGEVKTPPFSPGGRLEVGILLRRLQQGESLGLPQSRPMPSIGPRCHELRVTDQGVAWRIICRVYRYCDCCWRTINLAIVDHKLKAIVAVKICVWFIGYIRRSAF